MQEERDRPEVEGQDEAAKDRRPQRAGEAGTTRFGMEDGDNTDVPATGGPSSNKDITDRSS